MDDPPEVLLVEKARNGDSGAFAELVRSCQQRIYQTVFAFTKNHMDTDDLTQETFMTAWGSLRSFKQKSSFYTWVYRIAVNLSLNFLKKRGREKGRAEFDENIASPALRPHSSVSPEGRSLKSEFDEQLERAVASLSPALKASFVLVVQQGLSHAETAKILGCSENTVSWRMHKTRKLLQKRLKPYFYEVPHDM